MALKITTVTELPELNQAEFGPLPSVPEGMILRPVRSTWEEPRNETIEAIETMTAVLVQACIDAGQWRPLSVKQVMEAWKKFSGNSTAPQIYWDGFATLRQKEYIEVVELNGAQYVVPRPSLVTIIKSRWMVRPSRASRTQPTREE